MYKENYHADEDHVHSFWVMYYKYKVNGIEYTKRIIDDELLESEYTFYYNPNNPKKLYNIGDGKRPLRVLLTLAPIAIFFMTFIILFKINN